MKKRSIGLFGRGLALSFFLVTLMTAGMVYRAYHAEVPGVNTTRRVVNPRVVPGGQLILEGKAQIYTGCASWIYRTITDSTGTLVLVQSEYRPEAEELGVIEQPSRRVTVNVPAHAALGPAQYTSTLEWSCNAIQRLKPIVVHQPPLEFEIVRPHPIKKKRRK